MDWRMYTGLAIAALVLPLVAACGGDSTSNTSTAVPYLTNAAGSPVTNTAITPLASGTSGTTTSGQSAASPAASAAANPTTASTSAAGAGVSIATSEKDFSITPDKTTFAAGKVTFNITNGGQTQHQLVVLRTDLPEASLPLTNGSVNESAPGVTTVNAVDNIDPGQSATLTINNLPAGTYVLICNKPAHYVAGMHATVHAQ